MGPLEAIIIALLAVALVVTVILYMFKKDEAEYMRQASNVIHDMYLNKMREIEALRNTIETAEQLKIFDGVMNRGEKIHLEGFQRYMQTAGEVQLALLPTDNLKVDYLSGIISTEEAYNRYVKLKSMVLEKTYY